MDVYIINTQDDFAQYYQLLKDNARVRSDPDIYLIGFDIEFISKCNQTESFVKSPNWVKDNTCDIATCVIQIASEQICFVINLVEMCLPLPKSLLKIITNESWVKLGVGIENDLRILSQNYNLGHCSGGIDIKNFGLLSKMKNPNLESMYNLLMGAHIKKSSSICDWAKPLDKDKLNYAAQDAIMSYKLGREIVTPSIIHIRNKLSDSEISVFRMKFINYDQTKDKQESNIDRNYIGLLNNFAQQKNVDMPKYTEIITKSENGNIKIKFKIMGTFMGFETFGVGTSKKKAKQNCAKKIFSQLKLK